MSTETEIDPVREFVALLAPHARAALHVNQRVVGLVHGAVREQGWSASQLATECSRDIDGVMNAGAVIVHRLQTARDRPPPSSRAAPVIPLCGDCEDGWLLDPETRLPTARCSCRTPEATT